jgi:hypothetical protein
MDNSKSKRRSVERRDSKGSGGSLESVDQYVHDYEKRPYNPPVGLVTPETDKEMPRRKYQYDPHLDPQLQWTGKKEHTSFEVDTVSLHVHERIDPLTIIEKARKKQEVVQQTLFHYFEQPQNNPPLREAIDFYKHNQNWSNRLIAGDSLLVMNSLLHALALGGGGTHNNNEVTPAVSCVTGNSALCFVTDCNHRSSALSHAGNIQLQQVKTVTLLLGKPHDF